MSYIKKEHMEYGLKEIEYFGHDSKEVDVMVKECCEAIEKIIKDMEGAYNADEKIEVAFPIEHMRQLMDYMILKNIDVNRIKLKDLEDLDDEDRYIEVEHK